MKLSFVYSLDYLTPLLNIIIIPLLSPLYFDHPSSCNTHFFSSSSFFFFIYTLLIIMTLFFNLGNKHICKCKANKIKYTFQSQGQK
ncbi:hypothetical protein BC941DRAFT_122848 [Chlamydoabsidia padenii]|nr:hypothetical protein BC941DRAFT_122848 [Chlamydoabsidia padenii]